MNIVGDVGDGVVDGECGVEGGGVGGFGETRERRRASVSLGNVSVIVCVGVGVDDDVV